MSESNKPIEPKDSIIKIAAELLLQQLSSHPEDYKGRIPKSVLKAIELQTIKQIDWSIRLKTENGKCQEELKETKEKYDDLAAYNRGLLSFFPECDSKILAVKIKYADDKLSALQAENDDISEEYKNLFNSVGEVKGENWRLNQKITALELTNNELQGEVSKLRGDVLSACCALNAIRNMKADKFTKWNLWHLANEWFLAIDKKLHFPQTIKEYLGISSVVPEVKP